MSHEPVRYTAQVELDPETNEHVIQLSEDMLAELGWQIGDALVWTAQDDGSYIITRKKPNTVQVLVETVELVRHRYVIEAPSDHADYALDSVIMRQDHEGRSVSPVSSQRLDEITVSHRVITENDKY